MTLHTHICTLQITDPRGLNLRTVQYHRSKSGEAAQARVHHRVIDPAGHEIEQRDPRLFAMAGGGARIAPSNLQTTYSLGGLALAHLSADSGLRVLFYGAAGQMLQGWDGMCGAGPGRRTVYDQMLRPVSVYETLSGQPERCAERMAYGGRSVEHQAHNCYARLIRHDDPAGVLQVSDYDLRGELRVEHRVFLAVLEPDWPESESARNALVADEPPYTSTWQYDALGAIFKRIDARKNAEELTYDVAGGLRQATVTLADGREQTLLRDVEYSATGQVQRQVSGNGVVSQFDYDVGTDHLLRSTVRRPAQGFLQDYLYTYDPVGNVVGIHDLTQPVRYHANQCIKPVRTFRYDTLYQLIEASGCESHGAMIGPDLPAFVPLPGGGDTNWQTNYTQLFTYDAGGNLLTLQHSNHPTRIMAVASHSNRALAQDGDTPPDIAAGYDQYGNLRTLSPGGQVLTWSARHQLQRVIQVARAESADDQEEYCYDGNGQRVRKLRTTWRRAIEHTDQTLYLPGLELRTGSSDGQTLATLNVTGAQVLCWSATGDVQVRYSFTDHLGSCALELDAEGTLISVEQFYPFGGTSSWGGSSVQQASYKTIRYSGKERDATGLYYYGLRYYAPWLQRWINPDPAGVIDGLNLYRFVRNNPVTLADISGLAPWKKKNTHGVADQAASVARTPSSHTDEDYLVAAMAGSDGGNVDQRYLTNSALKHGEWKPAQVSTLMGWADLAPTQKLVHMVRWNSGHLLSDSAEKVFAQWDVFSTSLIDLQNLAPLGGAGDPQRHTGAIGDVGFVLKVAPQNIIGVHERDISFQAHVGMWTDPGSWQRTVDMPYALTDYIHNSDEQDRPARSNTLMTPAQVMEKTQYPFSYSHNEILVAGRAGQSLYQDLKPTRAIEVESIIVMPYRGGSDATINSIVAKVARLNPGVAVQHY